MAHLWPSPLPVPMRVWLAILAVSVLVISFPVAPADHVQEDGTRYDHAAGNQWWVEVNVTYHDVEPHFVWARVEGRPWEHQLQRMEWGNWAKSFFIPAGARVQFLAGFAGSSSDILNEPSCFFTHPQGVEQCDPGSTDRFRATFHSMSGNEWWQQVYVDSNRPVSHAWVLIETVNGRDFRPLTHRSWGAWANSYHAPDGTTLRFQANSGPESERTGCFRWPDATPTDCRAPSRFSQAFETTFDHKTGNAWWVEARVGPIKPTRVMAQDTNGPWVELTYRSWDAWANSFRIEPGHQVRFQALVEGDWYTSCWFSHPAGKTPDNFQLCRAEF